MSIKTIEIGSEVAKMSDHIARLAGASLNIDGLEANATRRRQNIVSTGCDQITELRELLELMVRDRLAFVDLSYPIPDTNIVRGENPVTRFVLLAAPAERFNQSTGLFRGIAFIAEVESPGVLNRTLEEDAEILQARVSRHAGRNKVEDLALDRAELARRSNLIIALATRDRYRDDRLENYGPGYEFRHLPGDKPPRTFGVLNRTSTLPLPGAVPLNDFTSIIEWISQNSQEYAFTDELHQNSHSAVRALVTSATLF